LSEKRLQKLGVFIGNEFFEVLVGELEIEERIEAK